MIDSVTFNCQAHRHISELWATVVGSPVSHLRHSGFKSRPFNRLFWTKFFIKPAVLTEIFHATDSFNWRFSYNWLLWMELFVPADWLKFFIQPAAMNGTFRTGWLTEVFHTTGCYEWNFSHRLTDWSFSYNWLLWMELFVPADWLKFFIQLAAMNGTFRTGWLNEVFHIRWPRFFMQPAILTEVFPSSFSTARETYNKPIPHLSTCFAVLPFSVILTVHSVISESSDIQ